MKRITYIFAILGSAFLFSCGGNNKQAAKATLPADVKPGKYAYLAIFEKDSASLTFEVATSGKVSGMLHIKYFNKDTVTTTRQSTIGDIKGEFKGDTLLADYSFTSGKTGKEKFINPVALLKKGDTLVMGSGRVMEYLGRTYFDDKTPINYTKSRFRFLPAVPKQ